MYYINVKIKRSQSKTVCKAKTLDQAEEKLQKYIEKYGQSNGRYFFITNHNDKHKDYLREVAKAFEVL